MTFLPGPEAMFFPIGDDNPTVRPPVLTIGIIAVCVLVFFYQLSLPSDIGDLFVQAYGVTPAALLGVRPLPAYIERIDPLLTVLTSMFLHGSIMHLVGNMLYLWVFGNNVEDSMGHVRYLMFYVVCGVAAALVQALIESNSMVPMIGASGAISGVLGAYFVLHPHATVRCFVFLGIFSRVIHIRAGVMLLIWIVLQMVSAAFAAPGEAGVAWFAHIGGFGAGLALVPFFRDPDIPLFGGERPRRRPWDEGGPSGRRGPWG